MLGSTGWQMPYQGTTTLSIMTNTFYTLPESGTRCPELEAVLTAVYKALAPRTNGIELFRKAKLKTVMDAAHAEDRNMQRHPGNVACPCDSGRKAKKCCYTPVRYAQY